MPTATTFFSMPPDSVSERDEARFFGQLKTGNDTFKRTAPGRLAKMDRWLIQLLALAEDRPEDVLDIGISSGVTTLEMAHALENAGALPRITGMDRSLSAMLVDVGARCRVLAEPNGHILQYDVVGRAIQPWVRRFDYCNGMILVRAMLHLSLGRRARARLRQGLGTPVALVSPRVSSNRAITLIESDITVCDERLRGRFDLVRAANILNQHYFSRADLERAVTNVRSYLRGPGAWLLILRTNEDGEHHASLMRMDPRGQLGVVGRYGKGSEVEAMFAG